MTFLSDPYSPWFWLLWPVFLLWQNYAFTMVSRARNSGSLWRHFVAAQQSNGVWYIQQLFVLTASLSILQGKFGLGMAGAAFMMYTASTTAGSLYAHYRAMRKEKGLAAVGANKKYAQVPVEEWAQVRDALKIGDRTK